MEFFKHHFIVTDFREIKPIREIKPLIYIPKTHLFEIHEIIESNDKDLIDKYIHEDLDILQWISVQSIKKEKISNSKYNVTIKAQNNTSTLTVSSLQLNLQYAYDDSNRGYPRQRDRTGFKVDQDSIKITGLEKYENN